MWLLPAWQHSGSEWETCVWAWHGSPGAYGPAGPMTRASGRLTSAGEDLPLAASSAFFFFSFFFDLLMNAVLPGADLLEERRHTLKQVWVRPDKHPLKIFPLPLAAYEKVSLRAVSSCHFKGELFAGQDVRSVKLLLFQFLFSFFF